MSWFNSVIAAGSGRGYGQGSDILSQSGSMGEGGGLDWVRELGFGGSSASTDPFSAGGFSNFYGDTFSFINQMLQSSGIPVDVGGGMASAQRLLGSEFADVLATNDIPGTRGYMSTSEAFLQNNSDVLSIYREEQAAQARERG